MRQFFFQAIHSSVLLCATALIGFGLMHVHGADGGSAQDQADQRDAREVELQGRVICLAEEMHRLHEADLPTDHPHLYGFKTNDGKLYTLLRTKYSEALFVDERLRKKELLLKGRLLANGHIFDVATIRSVIAGVVHDLHYFCVVCNIITIAPGICECCQDPVELIEKPRATQ
jgi:hypothetical protein